MMLHLIDMTQKNDLCLTNCLESLVAVVFAVVSAEGVLLQANQGCRHILNITSELLPNDIRPFFIQPSFSQLLAMPAVADRPVYAGILTLGNINAPCRSLIGSIHRRDGQLVIIGEYDIAEMERLNSQVIALNEELAAIQRELARSNRQLHENEKKLIEMSMTDTLTGMANRRHLMEHLQSEVYRYQRDHKPFSVIMADIDFFKHVNDEFGHEVGDVVLKTFSSLMKNSVRNVDLVARLGGEEFIIVLPNATLADALSKANQLRYDIEHSHYDGLNSGVTASFGVAEFHEADDVSSLLKHADEATYHAKHTGRNCVIGYPFTKS